MNSLRKVARPLFHLLLLTFATTSLYMPASQAAIIGTGQLLDLNSSQGIQALETRQQLQHLLSQDSIQQQLLSLGVDSTDIQARIDNMSPQELTMMAGKMEQLPAGQGIVGLFLTLFIVLLVTDILGYTDVFPFVINRH